MEFLQHLQPMDLLLFTQEDHTILVIISMLLTVIIGKYLECNILTPANPFLGHFQQRAYL